MNSLVHRATRCRRVSATWSCVLVLAAPMALAARTDEPLAEAQALATGIATAGLSRLVELGGSVLSAQLCVVAMRVSGGALALTAVAGADAADAAFLVAPDGPARRTLAADDPVGNEAIGRFPDAYRCAPAASAAPRPSRSRAPPPAGSTPAPC